MKTLIASLSTNNVFAGLVVAVVALPLCIAFAVASGAHPVAGIVSGVVGGFLAAAFGSSRFQVSGPSAAFITVVLGIVSQHGVQVMLAATLAAGVIVMLAGALRLGRVMDLMPRSVLVGFTTGVGVLIVLSQVPAALGIDAQGKDVLHKIADAFGRIDQANPSELLVLAATAAAALVWGRTRLARRVLPALVALFASALLASALTRTGAHLRMLGDAFGGLAQSLAPSAGFLATLPSHHHTILLGGLTLGFLIALETLLASSALDRMGGGRHDPDRELLGVGLANVAVPFLGGIPVSGVIVRGSANVAAGASSRSAAMLHALFLGLFVLAFSPLLAALPMAGLAAVLVLAAVKLVDPGRMWQIFRIDRTEGATALLTAGLTVAVDLTVSVPLGVSLMLVLALRRMLAERRVDVEDRLDHTVVALRTSVNFLTAAGIRDEVERHLDERVRSIDLVDAHHIDGTGALVLADLLAPHPGLEVRVRDAATYDRLAHAGVAAERMRLVGSELVDLPGVFEGIAAQPGGDQLRPAAG